MKILFDQGTPVPLRRSLLGHTVDTAYERGWSTLANGDLLDTAERDGYNLLVTTDRNLRYQQNLTTDELLLWFCCLLLGLAFKNIKTRFGTRSTRLFRAHTSKLRLLAEALF